MLELNCILFLFFISSYKSFIYFHLHFFYTVAAAIMSGVFKCLSVSYNNKEIIKKILNSAAVCLLLLLQHLLTTSPCNKYSKCCTVRTVVVLYPVHHIYRTIKKR